MNDLKIYAIIFICAALGGLGGYFASGLATAGGIAIGAGVGVAIATPIWTQRRSHR